MLGSIASINFTAVGSTLPSIPSEAKDERALREALTQLLGTNTYTAFPPPQEQAWR
jgi:hypothetical protein